MISPQLVAPLASVLGWPVDRATKITGRLARENTARNPSRTAITAAALMIGLALVGFVTIFAAELRKSADDAINREVAGALTVYSDSGTLMPHGVPVSLTKVPGVATVSSFKSDAGKVSGDGVTNVYGIQPSSVLTVYHFQWKQGSNAAVTGMQPHDAFINDNFASGHKLMIGSTFRLTSTVGRSDSFRVAAIYKAGGLLGEITIPYDTFARDWNEQRDYIVSLSLVPGASFNAVQHRINALLKSRYPQVTSHSQAQLRQSNETSINQILALIYVLLGMSVVVSVFGIVNTLVLSVYERTREIGMLRAIGTSRTQVRWIVRWESVITAIIGAGLGLILGVVLAALVTVGLRDQGIEFTLPIGQLVIWLIFAFVLGIVAAAWPARRAARLDVLQAVSYE
jgi:putative ABC transport system permease protein